MLPPPTLKVAFMALAGYQAEFSIYLTGLNTKLKAESFKRMALKMIDQSQFDTLEFQVYGVEAENPSSQLESTIQFR